MVEIPMEVKVSFKSKTVHVVCSREQGSDLGHLTEEKFSGSWLVCSVQEGVGNDSTSFHQLFVHDCCMERMYESGRVEP